MGPLAAESWSRYSEKNIPPSPGGKKFNEGRENYTTEDMCLEGLMKGKKSSTGNLEALLEGLQKASNI
jgi:hypothetical protein